MAETANQVLYRNELVKTFERRYAMLEPRVVTDGIATGNQYVFVVNGSGNASAVTRGVNGKIPPRANDDTQATVTMTEWHDKPQATRFNIFAGQAGAKRRSSMQDESIAVLNRKADDVVLAALATSTQYAGTVASTLSVDKALFARTVVANSNAVMSPEDLTGLLTPAAEAYLLQQKEITSVDYVDNKLLPNMPTMFKWAGVMWMVHTGLPGINTNNERLYVFHRNAIGLARDRDNMNISAGYNDEEDYYYARASMFMGAVLLQGSGVCSIRHDGSAYTATA
jgi:hypothetical protein